MRGAEDNLIQLYKPASPGQAQQLDLLQYNLTPIVWEQLVCM